MRKRLILLLAAASGIPSGAMSRAPGPAEAVDGMLYLNFGYQESYYPDRTNAFLEDHGGPSFELEAGLGGVKITGYFAPWTTQPRATTRIWNDTLHVYDSFNPIKGGILLGRRVLVTPRAEWGLNMGLEWATFAGFKEKETRERTSIRMPTVMGAVFGIDSRRDILIFNGSRVGYKLSYRYSTVDYRVFNKALDSGTHEWGLQFSFGGKSLPRRTWQGPSEPEPEPEAPREFF